MSGAFWWVPSVVVLAVVVAAIVFVVTLLRRRTAALRGAETAAAAALAREAAISLVRADDLVESSTDELDFALAQFGEPATREFAAALAASRRQLSEAFALQQKLDDAVPDSAAERDRWNRQIRALAEEAGARLADQERDFDSKRGVEREAPRRLELLRRRLDRTADRLSGGSATIDRLRQSYAEHALAPISGNVERARAALTRAQQAVGAADIRLAEGAAEPVGEQLRAAEHALFQATGLLDAIEAGEDQLHRGFATLGQALTAVTAELTEARTLRDGHEESDTSAELNRAIADAAAVLAELREPTRLSDPAVDLARLETARDGLDVIRSEARNRQLRLQNARTALAGALLTVRSQLTVTHAYIGANRGRIGAAARTRLAEAERQLALALAEADPVVALDTARRAMTHATDADALAHYEAR
ncbi:hypothetical protein E3T55_07175 [Cryobacterium frigoriphilum]|uniref:TPM domain-containing protein n=1 Tax=Cryobacterium frigoriphilum TaxID=1259150 RepID=A0A4R9A4E5_9MICO|nr:hypothetical protein [Cryobacterium frigoriphilum]TFD52061.1 hypothetical protein E3T55_07175 [Cryobacterium frigoriphilum]